MTDKIAESVSNDTNKAVDALYKNILSSVNRLEKYDGFLKSTLETSRKKYNEGLDKLFKVDDSRHKVFFFSIYSNIVTVILLLYIVITGLFS